MFFISALISLETLIFDFSTSRWVTGHPRHGLPSCQFSACYTLPFSTSGQAWDRQTDDSHQHFMPPMGWDIINLQVFIYQN